MAFIETSAPRDWGTHTLLLYPYSEGQRNLYRALPCYDDTFNIVERLNPQEETETVRKQEIGFFDRVVHFIVGCGLLLPIVNTVVFVAMRELCVKRVLLDDPVSVMEAPEISQRKREAIDALNRTRNNLLIQLQECTTPEGRDRINSKIARLELRAASYMVLEVNEEMSDHLAMSKERHPDLTAKDGVIRHPSSYARIKLKYKGRETFFKQRAGLSQFEGANYLCGYYALFFMLQAVTDKEFANRDRFYPLLKKWTRRVALKKGARWLAEHRDRNLPYGLAGINLKGISVGEIRDLIKTQEELAPLKNTPGCFVLEIDDLLVDLSENFAPEPIQLLGMSHKDNISPQKFPIYFIMKGMNFHYYLIYAEKAGRFTVVHSLNSNVLNRGYQETFENIIDALTGTRTDLHLEW